LIVRHQGVTFENLADWLEGRLEGDTLNRVEVHLARGCPRCERDLAWLRRFGQAARDERAIPAPYPPADLVAQVRSSFRASELGDARDQGVRADRRAPGRSWRPTLVLAGTVVLILALFLAWQPGIVGRSVVLASAEGVVQVRSNGAGEAAAFWQEVAQGYRLEQGTQVRVSDGAAVVELFDGSRVQLGPGAEVELSALRSSVWGGGHRIAITQRNGHVIYQIASAARSRSEFTVMAPSSYVSAAAAKTFAVHVASDAATQVVVLDGEVTVSHGQTDLVLADREALLISSQGSIVLLPTLSSPSLAWPTETAMTSAATAIPPSTPTLAAAHLVASPTRAPATRTSTPVAPSATPTITRAQAPKPAPTGTPEPYDSRQPAGWLHTATPSARAPVWPTITPTCSITATCWPTAWPTRHEAPTDWPTLPPKIQTAIPKIQTIVSQVTPPHEWPTSAPRSMPTWPKH